MSMIYKHNILKQNRLKEWSNVLSVSYTLYLELEIRLNLTL